ncbi:hypothetical protein GCM10028808_23660 [Spirosoma migulaei]
MGLFLFLLTNEELANLKSGLLSYWALTVDRQIVKNHLARMDTMSINGGCPQVSTGVAGFL